MARGTDFVDKDYDRELEEFKARRDKAKREMAEKGDTRFK